MFAAFLSRLPFLFAAALIAAAAGDITVESAANAGAFGPGYQDDNHLGVLPTLLAGCFGWLSIAVCRAVRGLQVCGWRTVPFADVAADISAHPSLRDLASIFVLQLGAVFGMESAEQLLCAGTLPGGLSWLGAPLPASLLVHACFGAVAAFALTALMRSFGATLTAALRTALRLLALVNFVPAGAGWRSAIRTLPRVHAPLPFVRHSGERAPPAFSPSI